MQNSSLVVALLEERFKAQQTLENIFSESIQLPSYATDEQRNEIDGRLEEQRRIVEALENECQQHIAAQPMERLLAEYVVLPFSVIKDHLLQFIQERVQAYIQRIEEDRLQEDIQHRQGLLQMYEIEQELSTWATFVLTQSVFFPLAIPLRGVNAAIHDLQTEIAQRQENIQTFMLPFKQVDPDVMRNLILPHL